ncbi:hypothetical protein MP638_004981 [Amoeboaphelidium occidentale]|nr:hypothetical protein MP638_004981 [Amoeboaphelidium occidentale]
MSSAQHQNEQADIEMPDREDDNIDWSVEGGEVRLAEDEDEENAFEDSSVYTNKIIKKQIKNKLIEILLECFEDNRDLKNYIELLEYIHYLKFYGMSRSQLCEALSKSAPKLEPKMLGAQAIRNRSVLQALENSFNIDFNDEGALVQSFINNFMIEFGEKADSLGFYAPYCSLVQSSGCGKSRFLREVGKKAFVFFICLRDNAASLSTYPPRSACTDWLLFEKSLPKVGYYSEFLLACLAVLEEYLQEHEAEYKQATGSAGPSSGSIVNATVWSDFIDMQFIVQDAINENSVMGQEFWNKVRAKMDFLGKDKRTFGDKIKSFTILCTNKIPVLFAFDEARMLLPSSNITSTLVNQEQSMFRIMRKALKSFTNIPEEPTITAIFTDTNSKVANFSAPDRLDPSFRVDAPVKLKEPKWLLPGWSAAPGGLWEKHQELYMQFFSAPKELLPVVDKLPVKYESLFQDYYSIGRPLWYSFIQGYGQEVKDRIFVTVEKYKKLATTARKKLNFSVSETVVKDARSILAVLNCRLGFSIAGCSVVAAQLVADRMALNMYTGNNREFLSIGYPYEPMLVNASIHWMNDARIPYLDQLKVLIDSCMEGQVFYGYKGELISRLLLTWAFDNAVKRSFPNGLHEPFIDLHAVTVYHFLLSLYGQGAIDALAKSIKIEDFEGKRKTNLDSLLNGYVRIGKWIKLETAPEKDTASYYFSLGVALMTTEGQPGCDKLIPVYLKDLQKFTWICIEDKNRVEKIDGEEHALVTSFRSIFKANPNYPYLLLLIQLGTSVDAGVMNLFEGFRGMKSGSTNAEKENKFAIGSYRLSTETFGFLQGDTGSLIVANLELLRREKFNSEYNEPSFAKEYKDVSSKWSLKHEKFVPVEVEEVGQGTKRTRDD